jgi:hypothetical protein
MVPIDHKHTHIYVHTSPAKKAAERVVVGRFFVQTRQFFRPPSAPPIQNAAVYANPSGGSQGHLFQKSKTVGPQLGGLDHHSTAGVYNAFKR